LFRWLFNWLAEIGAIVCALVVWTVSRATRRAHPD
jgi:hypothetical protein